MRLRKPGSGRIWAAVSARARGLSEGSADVVREVVAIAGEMVRIPARLFMRVAEAAGAATLAVWRLIWPLLVAAWELGVRAFRVAEREVTPLRAALAVAAATALALALSQFADYRSIAIGTDAYSGVEQVAPAPEVETDSTGSAHAWLGLPLGLAALAVVLACVVGALRNALLLAPLGIVVIAISLIVDAPKGLDEGGVAVAYQGAEADLLGGFWVQLACGVLLVLLAPLISRLMGAGRRSGAGRVALGFQAREARG